MSIVDKRILVAPDAHRDIAEITKLLASIFKVGKIESKVDEWGFPWTNKEDEERIKPIQNLMQKYSYGWYIESESYDNQIKSLIDFAKYIIDNIGKEVVYNEV